MYKSTHIVVADDNTHYQSFVRAAFETLLPVVAISQCENFTALKKALVNGRPASVVLLDTSITGLGGLPGILALRAIAPNVPVVIVSEEIDAPFINRAYKLGTSGFISKSVTASQLLSAVTNIMNGQTVLVPSVDLRTDEDQDAQSIIEQFKTLTKQQVRVLGYLCEGLLNKQIAFELSVSEATVKAHVSAILQKLKVESRTQAVATIARLTPETGSHAGFIF